MSIHYNVPGAKRKELVKEIATWLGCEAKYLGMPSCSYNVGFATIDKDGNFTVEDTADEETVERLIEHLYDAGFESDMNADSDSDESDEERICVSFPEIFLPPEDEGKLQAIIEAKGHLFKKAFSVDSLPIEREDGNVAFPWLHPNGTSEEIEALHRFLSALCKMARNAKRVTAKEKPTENEKYAMRCFLLRLGLIGDDYKEIRKTILKNFSGSSAFKSGEKKKTYKVELDGDNFKVFTAENDNEAFRIGTEIAKELGSEFCEVNECEVNG